ncbi:hypothetical protein TMatcc_002603 [Talaromyces marneffei ATCC 18224]
MAQCDWTIGADGQRAARGIIIVLDLWRGRRICKAQTFVPGCLGRSNFQGGSGQAGLFSAKTTARVHLSSLHFHFPLPTSQRPDAEIQPRFSFFPSFLTAYSVLRTSLRITAYYGVHSQYVIPTTLYRMEILPTT